jgi:hypothetical protein
MLRLSREQNMKLTNEEIDILILLISDKLDEIYNGPEGIEEYWKPEILKNLSKKLDKMLFS